MKRLLGIALRLPLLLVIGIALAASGAAFAADAPQKWILSVKPGFGPSDVQAAEGALEWCWKEAGIAVAVSADPRFGEKVLGNKVSLAVADMAAAVPQLSLSAQQSPAPGSPVFDGYANNWQWYWQAIGAVRHDGFGGPPLWQLGDYEGSGVKIGIIDTGAPSLWDPPDPFVPNPVALHPEFDEFDPAHPEEGGVVLLRDPDTGDVTNLDPLGHGTAVGSSIGARHRGEGAMRGLAPKATLYFHKVDWNNFYSSVLEGWWKAADFGCQILNNSWFAWDIPVERYGDIAFKFPIIFRKAAAELHRRGVLIVAAATNDAIDPKKDGASYYPWCYYGLCHGLSAVVLIPQDMPNVIVAGGTGPTDYDPLSPDLSRYNPAPGTPNGGQKGRDFNLDLLVNAGAEGLVGFGSAYGPFLTVMAPMGGNVKDSDWDWSRLVYQHMYLAVPWVWPQPDYYFPPYHDWWRGTSFSSPITCGTAALAAEAYKRVHGEMPSPTTLASILKASAEDLVGPATDDLWVWNSETMNWEFVYDVKCDKPGNDMRYGYGRVNVVKAIEMAGR